MTASRICDLFRRLTCSAALATAALAHPGDRHPRAIEFPDLDGYQTLVCDFHQHTVFSDGLVWPKIRVQEATRDGLDAIAITDHLEYQPHKADIPHPDRNRAHDLAQAAAPEGPLLIVRGAEISRDFPPGHANAIFLQDANKLLARDPLDAFREAARQGAFVFWNHPSWLQQTPDGVARLTAMHEQLFAEKLIHGIEVVNEHEYSDESLQIALDRNLAILGNSDIHGLIDWSHGVPEGGHRPVTLVFAREKTAAALHEALLDRRTAVWFKQTLIGRPTWLERLIGAALTANSEGYGGEDRVLRVRIVNQSSADFILRNLGPYRLHQHADVITVKAHTAERLLVKTVEKLKRAELRFEVLNAITAPGVHATLTLPVAVGTP